MKTKLLSVLSAIIIGFVAVSCSSSDDNQEVAVTFPENKTLVAAAGAVQQIDVVASHNFNITCDKSWIRLVSGDPQVERETVYDVAPGTHSFKILVKETGVDFTDQTATITMTMQKKEQVIYTITRSAMVRTAKMIVFDATATNPSVDTPQEVDKLDFMYKDRYKYYFSFSANFKWKLKSQPDWIEELTKNTLGEANEKVIITSKMNTPTFVAAKTPFTQTGAFVIEDVSNPSNTITFPVTFDGMTDDVVSFTPLNLRQGVNVSDKGMFTNASGEPEGTKLITTLSRDMYIKVAHISYNFASQSATEITGTNRWVTCTENPAVKGEYTLKVAENTTTAERIMYLYFLPEKYKTVAFPFANDFPNNFFQSEYGVKITQQGKPLADVFTFSFKTFSGVDPTVVAPAVPFPDAALAGALGVNVNNIYQKVFKASEWVEGKNLEVKLNGKPEIEGGMVVEDPREGISTGGTESKDAKTFMLYGVKPYTEMTKALLYFFGSEDSEGILLVIDKE